MTHFQEAPFPVWQGFHHSWTYNHRLNRIGDWTRSLERADNRVEVETGHSAASGSGPDEARFTTHTAVIRAGGVHSVEFRQKITISGTEQAEQIFDREFRAGPADGIPAECEIFAALLSGFDLVAEDDADKLSSFHVATTTPARDPATGDVVFNVVGALNVDCDSPECDNVSTMGALVSAIASGVYSGAQLGAAGALGGALFGVLMAEFFAKLQVSSVYTLTLRLTLICGTRETLAISRSTHTNALAWDTETAIRRSTDGIVRVTLTGNADPVWRVAVPAINQISLEITRERGVFRPDTAMHLLEWDMAIRPDRTTGTTCEAELDLFFRNWRTRPSVFFDEFIESPIFDELVQGFFTHRDAGVANAMMGVTLLQFADSEPVERHIVSDDLVWEGEGKSAKSADAVVKNSKTFVIGSAEEPAAPTPPPPATGDTAPAFIVTRNIL